MVTPRVDHRRLDTGTNSIRLGMWLFLASEAMLFASVFAAYVLLRMNAVSWPDSRAMLAGWTVLVLTSLLLLATRSVRRNPAQAAGFGLLFLLVKIFDYVGLWNHDVRPAQNIMVAMWYVMTGVHWLHVAGGVTAAVWLTAQAKAVSAAHQAERLRALMLYWMFIDLVWLGIIVSFYIN